MNSFLLSTFVLIVWSQIAFGNFEDDVLRFQHTRYAQAIKESHKLGKTSIFVKAFGCHDKKVKYFIQETNVPFKINPDSGRIFLTQKLNYDLVNSYGFSVKATADNGKCEALTLVRVDVLNVDKNRPRFSKNVKYHCRIKEKTGHVKIWPKIKVEDPDTGAAGRIKNVQVRESEQPFFTELKQSTGEVVVKSYSSYTFNADRISSYDFSLQAWDSGDPPRNSPPLVLHCKVVPDKKKVLNSHVPVFTKKEYIGRVKQGETSANIVQVGATDGDSGVHGKVCKYIIRTSDIPFSIDKQGVISLNKPLPVDSPDNYVFVVTAKDCGGKISQEGAMVNIIVDKDCIPGFADLEEKLPRLKGCDGLLHVAPQIRLNGCGESRLYANFTASVTMETAHVLKGCDRETYEASGVFKLCNVNKTIDLLPSAKEGHKWMAALLANDNIEGENMYQFDGKTAIDVPSHVIKYDGRENMTVSTWIWMKQQNRKQFIIAATDPQRLDRKHFGLYTQGDKLIFIHRQEKTSGTVICKSQFTWKPKIFDVKWHHVVVTVEGCNTARLFVDSKEIVDVHMKSDWPLHGSNMATRVVVGARWLGREQKYGDYFEGYLAGLSLNTREAVSQQAINCVFKCKENIKIDIPAPDGFQVKQKSHKVIEIDGRGRPETFEKLLRSLVYVNTRRSPTIGRRPLQISATVNNQPLATLSMEVVVETEDSPKLELSGGETKTTAVSELRKYGIPISRNLKIAAGKCFKYLDEARIEVEPRLTKDESLVYPGPLLHLYNLKKQRLPSGKGLAIRGLATIAQYQSILREMVFVHLAPIEGIRHTFKFSVSDVNQRFVSNVLESNLTTVRPGTKQQFDMQAINRQEKDAMPGAEMENSVAEKSGKSLGVVIGVTIACSSLFVFVILVVVIRLRSGDPAVVYTDIPENEPEVVTDDTTVMNVTMNPLEKFEDIDIQEKNEADDRVSAPKAKNDKMNLEWDDAYIA